MAGKNPFQYNPIGHAEALDALTSTPIKFQEMTNKKSFESNFVIDNQRGDTVTRQRFDSRKWVSGRSATVLFQNPDRTLTTIPKYPLK